MSKRDPFVGGRAPRGRAARGLALALCAGALAPAAARAVEPPVMLQWFEQDWNTVERRVPDFFMAGYGSVWMPPPSICSDAGSPGYDVFDQFNLGQPGDETLYGTEADFGAMVRELKQAAGLVYVDTIMNHRSGRRTDSSFYAAGGYPGMYAGPAPAPGQFKQPTDDWGDFHAGNALGYLQSENPGGANYDRVVGDLVALIDINHGTNIQAYRHPVFASPFNLPAGTLYNKVDPANIRFYPDRDLTPINITSSLNSRLSGGTITLYPFNTGDPAAGEAIRENATAYLMRWVQWMLEVQGIDGFRLDASKHTAEFFWDEYFDSACYMRWTRPDGQKATPFTFGENTEGNFFILSNYYRKDSFADRDALDLTGAGSLRNLKSGLGTWSTPVFDANSGHLDNADDGFNNGSAGVMHIFSHDNGSQGDGGSAPPVPNARDQAFPMTAYLMTRPGHQIVYFNARQSTRPFGFWPREGYLSPLGWNRSTGSLDPTITDLVKIRNQYARGYFIPLNGNYTDNLVFSRRTPTGGDNLLVGVSDRYDSGFDTINVTTAFPQGTRLHELTGNAANPAIDPNNSVPDVITVGANGSVSLVVPRNASSAGEHDKGYVIYGEAVPFATLSIPESSTSIPADSAGANPATRRITQIPIVTGPTFTIRVDASAGDQFDGNSVDDNAVFRVDKGYQDLNNNGGVDFDYSSEYLPGFEQFLTTNDPTFGGGSGTYEQTISSAALGEGLHYITVYVFRHRDPNQNAAPVYRELRLPVYVDAECPDVVLEGGDQVWEDTGVPFRIVANDRTTTRTHLFVNLPQATDPLSILTPVNQAQREDRFSWIRSSGQLQNGVNRVTVVAVEESGRACYTDYAVTYGTLPDCPGDVTTTNTNPGDAGYGQPDGNVDGADLSYFVEQWIAGCP